MVSELNRPDMAETTLCGNCDERPIFSAERCQRCYDYRHRTGTERPKDLDRRAVSERKLLALAKARAVRSEKARAAREAAPSSPAPAPSSAPTPDTSLSDRTSSSGTIFDLTGIPRDVLDSYLHERAQDFLGWLMQRGYVVSLGVQHVDRSVGSRRR